MNHPLILKKDPIMEELINRYGILTLADNHMKGGDDLFRDLTNTIVGQQLSNKVADVIWNRVVELLDREIKPANFLMTKDEDLRATGISMSKAKYIKNLATAVHNNTLKLHELHQMSDEEVIIELTKIKGIGRWTAEMFLIFSLSRPDVFSLGDGGLLNAMKKLYGSELTNQERLKIAGKWQPYRSYASLYLWKSLD